MSEKTGLLLVNLGSPDAPTAKATRKYLFQFLHDHRVIELTRWLWCPILHGIILRTRPKRSAAAYAKIWDQPDGVGGKEAPLIRITRHQAAGIQDRLGDDVSVKIAMRYGNPSIASALAAFEAEGITKVGVFPLYPQFAGAKTASVTDDIFKSLKNRRNAPELRFIRDYHDDPRYIAALRDSAIQHFEDIGWKPDRLLASFHGLPQTYVDKGDPYQDECRKTGELLAEIMPKDSPEVMLTFQSRFGPKAWLQPYTDKTLEALPEQGVKRVAVICPGFSADCLETLEEIAIEAKETFLEAGGEAFTMVPCLNASKQHIDLLTKLAKERLL